MKRNSVVTFIAMICTVALAGCSANNMSFGGASNTPSASAQDQVASGEKAPAMKRCSRNYGKATIVEKNFPGGMSPLPYAREAIQSTNCFTLIASGAVVEELFGAGASRKASNAQYALVIEPANSEQGAAKAGGGFGSLLPKIPVLGGLGLGASKNIANVQLTVYKKVGADVQQVTSVQGTAEKWDFAGGVGVLSLAGIGGIGGAENTGKNRMLMNAIFHAAYLMAERI
ncbi:MAG: hypothetical protein COU68_04950 [Candidatus Pacebacteria bacterium CG10_big_fil_rev_8_21_14_0_10_45_6]|nr:MAG: hypothetical protein COU68_04950 [Candidatus Pacebacteria bacterium CG10_big_fil_rev_8_21_14_0_10_45_6]